MALIASNAPESVKMITIQVTARNVSAAMVIATHQTQVFSVADFKLMTFFLWSESQFFY
jgi:hypothetical protein